MSSSLLARRTRSSDTLDSCTARSRRSNNADKFEHIARQKSRESHPDLPAISKRHIPFYMWWLLVSMYCCGMYLSMNQLRAPIERKNSFRIPSLQKQKSEQKFTPLDLVEKSAPKNATLPSRRDRSENEDNSENEIIHVVQTRFMQGQPDLLELGLARLALFEAFCVPSMISQTNKKFIWIIRTDPHLHPVILSKMMDLIEGKKNFFLIGSNHNPEGFGRPENGSFDQFLRVESNVTDSKGIVWSGNVTMLEEAYKKSTVGGILLETRLDGDDGLHRDFIKTIQKDAIKHLANEIEDVNAWRVWCVHSNIEWHPFNPYPETPEIVASLEQNHGNVMDDGFLVLFSDNGICVTPGLTFGYGNGASRSSIGDRLRHDQIMKEVRSCDEASNGSEENKRVVGCRKRLTNLVPGAVRTRTTTSAGMHNVFTGDNGTDKTIGLKKYTSNKRLIKQFFEQDKMWKGLSVYFSVSKESAKDARWLIMDRMQEIAADNLRGQCTPGHSCKQGAQYLLEKMAFPSSV
ncbi:hypothetical protein ACHAXS_011722 [Conticribra weissflogii]